MSTQKKRIGIPRTLFYYYYYPFFQKFFTEMDAEVIVSRKTNKIILENGLNTSSNELCLPIKLLYGHVLELKDQVDYILMPYMITMDDGTFYCPKLIGSPDMVKANIPDVKLLSLDVDMSNFYSSFMNSLLEVASKLSFNPIKIYTAYNSAIEYQKRFDEYMSRGLNFEEALIALEKGEEGNIYAQSIIEIESRKDITIALIGHMYVFNDNYISSEIIKKLRERNVRVLTSDAFRESEISEALKDLERQPHWSLGRRVLGAAVIYSGQKNVDGIIYMTPFGCSSDSLIREYIDANMIEKKPILTLTVDEHSADVGFITRIEAFLDMIDRQKIKNNDSNTEDEWISIEDLLTEQSEGP